jgi:hypothetical protein
MRNRWSSGISDHCACNRAHGAEHHRTRQGTQGSITPTPFSQSQCRRQRQKYRRRKDKSFHLRFPPNIVFLQMTLELRPNNGTL